MKRLLFGGNCLESSPVAPDVKENSVAPDVRGIWDKRKLRYRGTLNTRASPLLHNNPSSPLHYGLHHSPLFHSLQCSLFISESKGVFLAL